MNLVNSSWTLQNLDSGDRTGTPGKCSKRQDILTGRRPSWTIVMLPRWHEVLGLQCQTLLSKSRWRKTAVFLMYPNWFHLGWFWMFGFFQQLCWDIIHISYNLPILEHFDHLRKQICPHQLSPPSPPFPCPSSPEQPRISVTVDWPILMFHTNGIIQYVVVCDWLLSLSMTSSRFIHFVVCFCTSFLSVP